MTVCEKWIPKAPAWCMTLSWETLGKCLPFVKVASSVKEGTGLDDLQGP